METPASERALRLVVLGAHAQLPPAAWMDSRGRCHDRLGGEPELLVERLVVGGGAVVVDAETPAGVADDRRASPDVVRGLDADAGAERGREHLVAVGLVLGGEPLAAGHRHHAGRDALGLELLARGDGDAAPRSRWPTRMTCGVAVAAVGEDVGAPGDALGRGERLAVEDRQGLAGQGQTGRPVGVVEDGAPGDRGLVGVTRADDVQARDGAQRGQVLDRLVGRAVLAEADRVVGPDVGDGQLLDGGEPDRRAACSRRRPGTCRRRGGSGPRSAMPLRIVPMACSRMPKCRVRP